jgi:hypothetical protein
MGLLSPLRGLAQKGLEPTKVGAGSCSPPKWHGGQGILQVAMCYSIFTMK